MMLMIIYMIIFPCYNNFFIWRTSQEPPTILLLHNILTRNFTFRRKQNKELQTCLLRARWRICPRRMCSWLQCRSWGRGWWGRRGRGWWQGGTWWRCSRWGRCSHPPPGGCNKAFDWSISQPSVRMDQSVARKQSWFSWWQYKSDFLILIQTSW